MLWQQHPEKKKRKSNELRRHIPQGSQTTNSVKIQTQTSPTFSDALLHALDPGKWLPRRDARSWFDSRGTVALGTSEDRYVSALLADLQHGTGGTLYEAPYWRDRFPKPVSGRFRITQDCCGAGAYLEIILGVTEWRSDVTPPYQKWSRKK